MKATESRVKQKKASEGKRFYRGMPWPSVAICCLLLPSAAFSQKAGGAMQPSAGGATPPKGTLVTVDGAPITRAEVADQVWSLYANQTLNQMVDRIVMDHALNAWKANLSAKEKAAEKKEVSERLGRIQSQFGSPADFAASLKRRGLTEEAIRKDILRQVQLERMVAQAEKISVTSNDIKNYFEQNKNKLGQPEAVHLYYLLAPTRQKAEEYEAAIKAGADFKKFSAQLSKASPGNPGIGGDLGFVSRGVLTQQVDKVVFDLPVGEVSPIVQTPSGFSIFEVAAKREAKPAVFDEKTKQELHAALLLQKINQALPAFIAAQRRQAKIVTSQDVTKGAAAAAAP